MPTDDIMGRCCEKAFVVGAVMERSATTRSTVGRTLEEVIVDFVDVWVAGLGVVERQ